MNFGMAKKQHPAIAMTQHAASKYCQWLSAQTGHYYRLPTEAEWEYACRAGTTTAWSWGNDPKKAGEYAWFLDNANFQYQKVGTKKPNPWGLHDMHGNVWEMCWDWYGSRYPTGTTTDPFGPRSGKVRVYRGGSWGVGGKNCRSAFRGNSDSYTPNHHTTYLGFRLCLSAIPRK